MVASRQARSRFQDEAAPVSCQHEGHNVMRTMTPWPCFATWLFILLSVAASPSASAAGLRTIALSGDSAPGAGQGTTYLGFEGSPALNSRGVLSFNSSVLAEGEALGRHSLWRATLTSPPELLAMEGQLPPGSATESMFVSFGDPVVNKNGDVFYTSRSSSNIVSSMWKTPSGASQPTLVVEPGGSAPGVGPGVDFLSISSQQGTYAGSAGDTVFLASLTGSGVTGTNSDGLWHVDPSGTVSLVARLEDPVPGAGPEVFYWGFTAGFESARRIATVNGDGKVAFLASFKGDGVGLASTAMLTWRMESGAMVLAQKGSPVPGLPGSVYYGFGSPVVNDAGNLAFYASVQAVGPGGINGGVLMSDRDGAGLTTLYRPGDSAPGTGHVFESFRSAAEAGSNPVMNVDGRLAFSGNLTQQSGVVDTSNDSGIWSEGLGGALSLVAREGDQAPGAAPGVTFGDFDTVMPMLNGFGQTAFVAGVNPPTTGGYTNVGLWAQDRDGVLQLIVIEGGQLDVDDGPGIDLRTVSKLRSLANHRDTAPGENSGNEDGRASCFNDLGQIVFAADFTDGSSGVFVSNAVANYDGDYNGDGVVDAADYTVWRDTSGMTGVGLAADGDRDGDVDAADYQVWLDTYGQVVTTSGASASGSSTPEPGALMLAMLAASAGLRGRFFRRC